jgi:transcriptional regulator with XRE-family HTH domain/quercetin dioxygenase-like cupin family protein
MASDPSGTNDAARVPRVATSGARGRTVSEGQEEKSEPVVNLGARLKHHRQLSGMSLRELARQLGVSPSFVSQLENSKSQPSVATLYAISQLLDLSIDELFKSDAELAAREQAVSAAVPETRSTPSQAGAAPISRSDLGSPADAWPSGRAPSRLSVTRPGQRVRLEMDSGVVWEQLATNTGTGLDFIEVIYPPHSTSTNDHRMLQHAGSEFGYLIEGELEVTVGFDVVVLQAGDALGFDSAMPHLLANRTDLPARGIWFVRHPQA